MINFNYYGKAPAYIKNNYMVEVLKTNVGDPLNAKMLIYQIHTCFAHYTANFDLEDCDKILRVKCASGMVESLAVIDILKNFGFDAEVLPDEIRLMAS